MDQRPHPGLRAGLIVVMVASWSLNFIFGKIALRHFAPLTLAALRVELAALLMLPIYAVCRLARGSRVFHRRDFWRFAYLGLLGVGVNQACFTIGLNYTTVGHSALIIGLNPILILLLARLQGLEALTAKKVAGMAMAFVGVVVLGSEHGFSLRSGTLSGDLITFTGTLGLALYTVLGKRVAAEYDSVSMNAFNYFVGGILLLPLAIRQALGLSHG
ncbi:MAG TPA: DMT family transporter, partial [Candidatus Acidoferrales bacterium]|nr:DMT family transporter [Candidatus Acidoferrales bacterium]